jgi:hypothetical protein
MQLRPQPVVPSDADALAAANTHARARHDLRSHPQRAIRSQSRAKERAARASGTRAARVGVRVQAQAYRCACLRMRTLVRACMRVLVLKPRLSMRAAHLHLFRHARQVRIHGPLHGQSTVQYSRGRVRRAAPQGQTRPVRHADWTVAEQRRPADVGMRGAGKRDTSWTAATEQSAMDGSGE